MPDTKTKTKKIIFHSDRHFITTDRKKAQVVTAGLRNAGFLLKKCFQHLIIFVLADSEVLFNPALRKPANRYTNGGQSYAKDNY